jgi:hypothetical protein
LLIHNQLAISAGHLLQVIMHKYNITTEKESPSFPTKKTLGNQAMTVSDPEEFVV